MKTLLFLVVAVAAIPLPAQAQGDAVKGKTLFGRCLSCHATTTQNKVGSGLLGVAGRLAASVPGFKYSKALTSSGITWTDEQRDEFLAGPTKVVPGATVRVGGTAAGDRSDVIASLNALMVQ